MFQVDDSASLTIYCILSTGCSPGVTRYASNLYESSSISGTEARITVFGHPAVGGSEIFAVLGHQTLKSMAVMRYGRL